MACCTSYNRIPTIEALPIVVKTQGRDYKLLTSLGFSPPSIKPTLRSQSMIGRANARTQPQFAAVGSMGFCKDDSIDTPLEPRTSAGNFLSGILQSQRHLFQFAVAEQLDQLAFERERAVACKECSSSTESVLHTRIAEIKEYECQIAVEDVMYMSIVHKFSEIKVSMVPRLSGCIRNNMLDILPPKCKELESVHTSEVHEIIKEHLETVVSLRGRSLMNKPTRIQIHRLQLGRIYAASIMYGYFLKSASLRHHLESSLALTLESFHVGHGVYVSLAEVQTTGLEYHTFLVQSSDTQATSLCQESRSCSGKLEKLKNYMRGFDSDTLQRCAKLKSKEAVNLIEKHTWAIFGDERIGEKNSDNEIVVTIPSFERLVLEGVAFGSFLWDIERNVDCVYRLTEN